MSADIPIPNGVLVKATVGPAEGWSSCFYMLCFGGVARSLSSVVINKARLYAFRFLLMFVKMLCFEAGDEIVDLTCESLEPVVVDLTHNDSVVVSLALLSGPGSTRCKGLGHQLGLCRETQ